MTDKPDTRRLFIAIPLPEDVIADIAASVAELRRHYFDTAKWVAPSAMHITLKFLGDVNSDHVSKITASMDAAIRTVPAYRLHLHGFGAYPDRRRPRVLWIGTLPAPEPHLLMVTDLERSMELLGFQPETRKHTPHITIARIKNKRTVPWPPQPFIVNLFDNLPSFSVNRIVLFESTLLPQGAKYSCLHETTLTDESVSGGTIHG